jgi:hypothetical protein
LTNPSGIDTEAYTRTLAERNQYSKVKLSEFENYISRSDQFVKLFKKISSQQEGGKKNKGNELDEQKAEGQIGVPQAEATTSKVSELKSIRLSTVMIKTHIRTRYKHLIADKIFGYIS